MFQNLQNPLYQLDRILTALWFYNVVFSLLNTTHNSILGNTCICLALFEVVRYDVNELQVSCIQQQILNCI